MASVTSISQSVAPVLYAPRRISSAASFVNRVIAFGVASGCLTLLVLAAHLTPSPNGVGSHRGLGLYGCAMLDSTGIPCPSCGMTTSFTWFVRGNLLASFYIQPMGMVLAFMAACCVWGGFYIAATGRPVHRLLTMFPARAYLVGMLGFAILAWGWKIYLHLHGLDGWQ